MTKLGTQSIIRTQSAYNHAIALEMIDVVQFDDQN